MGKGRVISTKFGSVIRHARESKGYSLKELEEITGISASYINRLEHCERRAPSYPIIELLADALDLDVSELLEVSSYKGSEEAKSLSQLLLTSTFTIGNIVVEKEAKELLISIIEAITRVNWEQDTKLQDAFEIVGLIDDFKKELAG